MEHPAFDHLGLTFRCGRYYLKRSRIVEKITFNNRTFYAKFERIDEPPSSLLSTQHLQREYTVALPLVENGKTDYIVFEYKGKEASRFAAFMARLLESERDEKYAVFKGGNDEKVQIFLFVNRIPIDTVQHTVDRLAPKIRSRFGNDWKALPSPHLPDAYNIVTLPYARIESHAGIPYTNL